MRAHLSNAAYGVLDYAGYPVAMLVAAPTLLARLGTEQYGIWVVCTAAISAGGIVASGFGDANIQHIAKLRALGDSEGMRAAARCMVGINLSLGSAMMLLALALTCAFAHRIVTHDAGLYGVCVHSLAIASMLMLVRALESVCISTQRAFERYGDAIRISLLVRVATVIFAAVLTRFGLGIFSIMLLTLVLMSAGTIVQFAQTRWLLKVSSLWPAFDNATIKSIFGFGIFSWLQAISSVVFSQADRLLLGVSLGATAVTSYALCVQMAQPIYGVAAAGLHFLFPYLACRWSGSEQGRIGKAITIAFASNLLFVLCSTVLLVSAGPVLLKAWVGQDVARASTAILTPVAWSFALLGLGVTAYYALLARGYVRTVTLLNLAAGAMMLLSMAWLLPRMGIRGVALARLEYGFVTLGMYIALAQALRHSRKGSHDGKVLLSAREIA